MENTEYTVDVINWYVEEWKNDINLYNACYEFFEEFPPKCKGVYHIFKGEELLYVGCTVNFKDRVTSHLVRGTNSKDFINEATHVKCYQVEDKYTREMREYNEILNLKPTQNKKLPSLKAINRYNPDNGIKRFNNEIKAIFASRGI